MSSSIALNCAGQSESQEEPMYGVWVMDGIWEDDTKEPTKIWLLKNEMEDVESDDPDKYLWWESKFIDDITLNTNVETDESVAIWVLSDRQTWSGEQPLHFKLTEDQYEELEEGCEPKQTTWWDELSAFSQADIDSDTDTDSDSNSD